MIASIFLGIVISQLVFSLPLAITVICFIGMLRARGAMVIALNISSETEVFKSFADKLLTFALIVI
ncbi:hypothetical protein D3C85_1883740 [compost metagenome]